MSKANRRARGAPMPGQGQAPGRPTLHPAEPLAASKALLQAVILLGIPLTLLFVARLILHKFFPSLGY